MANNVILLNFHFILFTLRGGTKYFIKKIQNERKIYIFESNKNKINQFKFVVF